MVGCFSFRRRAPKAGAKTPAEAAHPAEHAKGHAASAAAPAAHEGPPPSGAPPAAPPTAAPDDPARTPAPADAAATSRTPLDDGGPPPRHEHEAAQPAPTASGTPPANAQEQDLQAASQSSHASFYSAGGWSHFGEDGEWLGTSGGPSAHAASASSALGAEHGDHAGAHHVRHHPHAHAEAQQDAPLATLAEENSHTLSGPRQPGAAIEIRADARAAAGPLVVVTETLTVAAEVVVEAPADGAGGPAAAPAPPAERAAVLDRVAELYTVLGRPCRACEALLQYCKAEGVAPESLQADMHARQLPDAKGLTTMVQDISNSLADLASDSGWHLVRDGELRLQYKHLAGVHAFRAKCVLDAPAVQLVALAREVDLCPEWNKYMTVAEVLRELSPTDISVYMAMWVPPPFSHVGFAVEANGADLLDEEGCLLITFGSFGKEAGVQLPASAAKHRKMRMLKPSCVKLVPLPPAAPGGPPRTAAFVTVYAEPGVPVPAFIISFVLKVFSPFVYGAVKNILASAFKSSEGALPQRIKLRSRELYDLVRVRTEDFAKTARSKALAEEIVYKKPSKGQAKSAKSVSAATAPARPA